MAAPQLNSPVMALKGGGGPGVPMNTSVDFWDVGQGGNGGLAPDAEFSQLVAARSVGTDSKGKVAAWVLGFILLAVAGYCAYEMVINERNPIDGAVALVEQHFGDGSAPSPAEGTAQPVKGKKGKKGKKSAGGAKIKSAAVASGGGAGKLAGSGSEVSGNPYWTLPNKLLGAKTQLRRTWTAEEEETWRAGLAHKFSYQRWKTVMDVKERRFKGSDAILWDALQDEKFWTRMQAAVGLAEFNVEVSLQSLESVMAKARSELVRDFFERFVKKPSAGSAYVMRQVVRLLDERGRHMALRGIDRSKDELRDLYLIAATQDPAPRIRRWADEALRSRPVKDGKWDELLAVIKGETDGAYLVAHVKNRAEKAPEGRDNGKLMTEDDLDKELAELESKGGDVEFYDEQPPEALEASDEETFDYEYEE